MNCIQVTVRDKKSVLETIKSTLDNDLLGVPRSDEVYEIVLIKRREKTAGGDRLKRGMFVDCEPTGASFRW